jgi:hypothetical protein
MPPNLIPTQSGAPRCALVRHMAISAHRSVILLSTESLTWGLSSREFAGGGYASMHSLGRSEEEDKHGDAHPLPEQLRIPYDER